MSARENLRNNLRWLRKSNKMLQQEVADLVGIKRSKYGAIEEGRSAPDLDLLVTFSELYVVSVDVLLSDKLESLWKKTVNPVLI